jgi:excisionase family DNA binding protein
MIGIEDASKILGRAKNTIYALAQARKTPYYRSEKMLQFKRSELIQWMESAKRR